MSDAINITQEERVAVTEHYYVRCYLAAVGAAIGLCVVAGVVAYVDEGSFSPATVATSGAIAVALAAVWNQAGYRRLRPRPYLLCLPALTAVALARWWPAVDQNALYFAVVGPIALVVSVAQGPREAFVVIAAIALGTCLAAVVDRSDPSLSSAQALVTATVGVLASSWTLKLAVQWNALIAISEAQAPESRHASPPVTADNPPLAMATRAALPLARPERRLRHPPLTALALDAAHQLAVWMEAIRALVSNPSARRDAWSKITGFHARELEVLLLLDRHNEADVARFLHITIKTVRNTADRALRRERRNLNPAVQPTITRKELSRELASTYPTVTEIQQLAADLERETARLRDSAGY